MQDKDKKRAYAKGWYCINRERILASQRAAYHTPEGKAKKRAYDSARRKKLLLIIQEKDKIRHAKKAGSMETILQSCKGRAKKRGIPFDLTIDDIHVPEFCPVLGIPLKAHVGSKGGKSNSPSLDRIIPSLGYIKGNVVVISLKANSIKHNASAKEIRKVADWLDSITQHFDLDLD